MPQEEMRLRCQVKDGKTEAEKISNTRALNNTPTNPSSLSMCYYSYIFSNIYYCICIFLLTATISIFL